MLTRSTVEIKDFKLSTNIGTYRSGETVPDYHILDLTLWISPDLVLIQQDGMDYVFDYDPLIIEIEKLASDIHYQTQERLMTRIVHACVRYPEIAELEIALRKTPIRPGSGSLGLRLSVGEARIAQLRTVAC